MSFPVLALAALALLALAPIASASKTVHSYFGNSGSTPSGNALDGGLFNTPRGVAVNVAGTGGASAGNIYVVNSSANRIDQFSTSGVFLRAFGRDVIEEGKPGNSGTGYEICDLTAENVAADCKAGVTTPAEGGTLSSPQGIAINQTTGHIYVSNQSLIRIDEFDATGHFVRAFGQDVVSAGPGNVTAASAKQTLTVDATEGQFKLTFRGQTTADIAFNAPATGAGSVQSALQALSTIGAGNATVTGGPGGAGGATPYVITFAGALANAPMPLISTSAGTTPLGGGAGASVVNTTTGATAYEICNAPADTCKTGTTGSVAGALKSTFSGQLAVAPVGAPNAGNVIVADPANLRVNEYTSSGAFVRSFGYDVANSPPNATTTFETCDASNFDVCKIGTSPIGSPVGSFATNAVNRVAVDSTGAIYTVEPTVNFRVQKFTPQVGPPTLSPSVFATGVLTGTSSSGATQNNPTDIAIGASDKVFVTKVFPVGAGTPAATVQERRVLELDSTGTLLDTHLAQGAINSGNGLAANGANGRLYLSTSITPHRVYVLADAVAPVATIDPTTGVSATGATLHGKVNPGGVLAGHHFEYVDDATFQATAWASAVALPEESSGNGASAAPVSRAITGLAANTLYHVRLVAKHSFGTSSGTSGEATFTTNASTPIVGPVADADAEESTTTLSGRVVPNGQATSYHFEWGPTASYGQASAAKAAGSGIASVFASDQISGLSPASTYHFRLVATSASGTDEGEDHTFTTDPAEPATCPNAEFRTGLPGLLPDCRAYEQVSPVDKNGFDVEDVSGDSLATPTIGGPTTGDGSRAVFSSKGSFGNAPWGGGAAFRISYLSQRDANGWSTRMLAAHPSSPSGSLTFSAFSRDLTTSILTNGNSTLNDDPLSGEANLYRYDHANDEFTLLLGASKGPERLTASPDVSHVAFHSSEVLTADPAQPLSAGKVYEVAGTQLRLVSRQPVSDAPFQSSSTLGGGGGSTPSSTTGAISDDGRRVFFTTPRTQETSSAGFASDSSIYRRSDGASTVLASPSKRTPADPDGPTPKGFVAATGDGNRVFFTSHERLSDDANTPLGSFSLGDLYRYDFVEDELVNLSAGTAGSGDPVLQGVAAIDLAGDRVYFVAQGQVVPGQGVDGKPNLFLWEDDGTASGATRFIATLDDGPSVEDEPDDTDNWERSAGAKSAQTTDGGRYLAFQSKAPLLPGFSPAGTSQLYRYDADADGGAGELICVSCEMPGTPTGDTQIPLAPGPMQSGDPPRRLTEDGTVLFSSPDPLVSRDSNGEYDAYLWEDGVVDLLSSGAGADYSLGFAITPDGSDAFILSRDALAPQDNDGLVDLYDVRVGGGLQSQQAATPPTCAGEGCRGEPSAAPAPSAPLSSSLEGPGNAKAQPTNARRCGKGKRRVKGRCVRRHQSRNHHHKRTAKKTGRASR